MELYGGNNAVSQYRQPVRGSPGGAQYGSPQGALFRGPLYAALRPPLEAPLHTLWGGFWGGGVKSALSLLESGAKRKPKNSKSSENISSKF